MTEAYAAGFFDGEGHIIIANTKRGQRGPRPRPTGFMLLAGVTNTDIATLEDFHARWGGRIQWQNKKLYLVTTRKKCWVWYVCSVRAVQFLRDIMPHLKQKLPQAELAIAFQETITRSTKRVPDDIVANRAMLCREMSRLKHVETQPGLH